MTGSTERDANPTADTVLVDLRPPDGREFAPFPALWEAAITEFVATVNRFSADGVIGEMDCFYAGWKTDREGGFSDSEVATLERLTPFLSLAIKSASLARIANTLVETYLGRDAGGCCKAASRGPSRIASRRCCGSAICATICATIRASLTARRPKRSFRSSTTMPTRS